MRMLFRSRLVWVVVVCIFLAPGWAGGQALPSLRVAVSGGYARLMLSGATNSIWTFLFSTNLSASPSWLPLATVAVSNTPVVLSDTTTPATARRFYRAALANPPQGVIASNMVWVGSGTFRMGSPASELDRNTDELEHLVTLTKGFFIGRYLVSQADYLSVMSNNPSYFNGVRGTTDYGVDLNRPVEQIYWYLATYYAGELTLRERQAGRIPANWAYRLPTEAEWEYACRAGTTNRFSYGDDPSYASLGNYAWYSPNASSRTHAVGQKLPNPWGLYDMHGNVYEWCNDVYDAYPAGWVIDPQGPSGYYRVFRGGSFNSTGKFCRSAGRYNTEPVLSFSNIGFRVVLAPQP